MKTRLINSNKSIQLIEQTSSRVYLDPEDFNPDTCFKREGKDTRVFAWRETCPYTLAETIVSRTYTFNGKDAWDFTESRV